MSRFVLLEHHWDGVHWDLMLDVGAVLRTWAIDAPIVPGKILPAPRWVITAEPISTTKGRSVAIAAGSAGSIRALRTPDLDAGAGPGGAVGALSSWACAELRRVGAGGSDLGPESARAWTFRLGNLD